MKKFTLVLLAVITTAFVSQAQWLQTAGSEGKKVSCFSYVGTNIFAGTNDGVLISANGGSNWTLTAKTDVIYSLTSCGTHLFAGNNTDGLSVTTNNGTVWTSSYNGMTYGHPVVALTTSGANNYAGSQDGMFISTDTGANWTAINTGLTNFNITSILAMSPYLSAATNGGGVFASSNNGASWSATNNGLTNLNVSALCFTSTYTLYAATAGGVFKFNTGTFTWTAVNNGLTNLNVKSICCSGSVIFAGTTGGGLFRTNDDGANWINVKGNLPVSDVISMFVANTDLIIGTQSQGAWRCAISSLTGIDEINVNDGFALYPNPAKENITVNINTKESPEVLYIYNALGELVKTEVLTSVQQKVSVSDLKTGVYFITICSKNSKQTQKLLIR